VQAVIALIAEMIERGEAQFQQNWFSEEKYEEIAAACRQLGTSKLKPLKEALPPETTYEEIKLVAAHLRTQGQI
jgi:ATP-dependent DNA helicase RecQ